MIRPPKTTTRTAATAKGTTSAPTIRATTPPPISPRPQTSTTRAPAAQPRTTSDAITTGVVRAGARGHGSSRAEPRARPLSALAVRSPTTSKPTPTTPTRAATTATVAHATENGRARAATAEAHAPSPPTTASPPPPPQAAASASTQPVVRGSYAARVAILTALTFGWRLFPCAPRSKRPLKGSHAHLDASADPDELRRMFAIDRPTYRLNIALYPAGSGLLVLDIDVRNGGDETLARLERKYGRLPETVRVISGAGDGSTHYYFRAPPGLHFPDDDTVHGLLGEGVEIKYEGYVVTPPSLHDETGRAYAWDLGAHPSDTPIADCPAWILALGRRGPRPVRQLAPATGGAATSFFGRVFALANMAFGTLPNGALAVGCPWRDEHTSGRDGDGSTAIMPPTSSSKWGLFACRHAHCRHRRTLDLLDVLPARVLEAARRQHGEGLMRFRVMRAWVTPPLPGVRGQKPMLVVWARPIDESFARERLPKHVVTAGFDTETHCALGGARTDTEATTLAGKMIDVARNEHGKRTWAALAPRDPAVKRAP